MSRGEEVDDNGTSCEEVCGGKEVKEDEEALRRLYPRMKITTKKLN